MSDLGASGKSSVRLSSHRGHRTEHLYLVVENAACIQDVQYGTLDRGTLRAGYHAGRVGKNVDPHTRCRIDQLDHRLRHAGSRTMVV